MQLCSKTGTLKLKSGGEIDFRHPSLPERAEAIGAYANGTAAGYLAMFRLGAVCMTAWRGINDDDGTPAPLPADVDERLALLARFDDPKEVQVYVQGEMLRLTERAEGN